MPSAFDDYFSCKLVHKCRHKNKFNFTIRFLLIILVASLPRACLVDIFAGINSMHLNAFSGAYRVVGQPHFLALFLSQR